MAMEHTVGQTTVPRRPVVSVNLRALAKVLCAPVTFAGRLLLGESTGPRAYRQEGFPEHEFYQILSGHRDQFGVDPMGPQKRNG